LGASSACGFVLATILARRPARFCSRAEVAIFHVLDVLVSIFKYEMSSWRLVSDLDYYLRISKRLAGVSSR
jgi:hypothetical protein